MTLSRLQNITFVPTIAPITAPTKISGQSFADVLQRQRDGDRSPRFHNGTLSIADFQAALTGDTKQDAYLLGERLSLVKTPAEMNALVDTYLAYNQRSAADDLSHLIATRRVSIHPLQDELDRKTGAYSALKSAASGYEDELVQSATGLRLSELEAEVEALKQKIAEDLELKFKREAGPGLLG
ncbi:hypothetical protein [Arenibacterium sp. LLYu02]|uniref:hypothetical protein n=1 Tax=Arenibacterium sp. LLYu02 TaxID=3404132 RepID=UPI003B2234A7